MAEARRAAVLGSPVAHSLSPVLHNAGYRTLGLTGWTYAAHELGEPELAGWVRALDSSWRGLSLTMPLKEAAFSVATPEGEKMPTDKLLDVSPLALRMSSPFNAGYWLAAA